MMEDWNRVYEFGEANDGMMENKRLDSCLYPPFFQFSIIPLIQIKQID